MQNPKTFDAFIPSRPPQETLTDESLVEFVLASVDAERACIAKAQWANERASYIALWQQINRGENPLAGLPCGTDDYYLERAEWHARDCGFIEPADEPCPLVYTDANIAAFIDRQINARTLWENTAARIKHEREAFVAALR